MFVKKFAAAAVALITAVLALPLFINDASASHGTDARIHDVDFGVFAPGEITGEEALNPEITVVGPEKLQLSGGYIKVELTGGETSAFVCGWNGGGGYLAYGTSVQSKAWVRPVEGLSEGVHSAEMTLFFDPCKASYERLGRLKAPGYVSWSEENRSQLIRIPRSLQNVCRAELRSGDPSSNPYIALSLLIEAGLYGVTEGLRLPERCDIDFDNADPKELDQFERLPGSFDEAKEYARNSSFIRKCLPECVIDAYLRRE